MRGVDVNSLQLKEAPSSPASACSRVSRNGFELLTELLLESRLATTRPQPVSIGIPFPRGTAREGDRFVVRDRDGNQTPTQCEVLAFWPDGSLKWLLLTFVVARVDAGITCLGLARHDGAAGQAYGSREPALGSGDRVVALGPSRVKLASSGILELAANRAEPSRGACIARGRWVLTDRAGVRRTLRVERTLEESSGPVRTILRQSGDFGDRRGCRFVSRISLFHGTRLVRVEFTLHNPNAARHSGGLWDLGDPGSFVFRDLSFELDLDAPEPRRVRGLVEVQPGVEPFAGSTFEIHQESSGGPNWASRNHVGADDRVPFRFRGYRALLDNAGRAGVRATPWVSIGSERDGIAISLSEFWQQFPKALSVRPGHCVVRLFPGNAAALHELQGGEQKTHTIWLQAPGGASPEPADLAWVHDPILARARAETYQSSGAVAFGVLSAERESPAMRRLCAEALNPANGLEARREIIDEYGWRHFGEVYADHEGEHYSGPAPVISHYNNQYDLILGFLARYLATGDRRWHELLEPLARHVADIDIYHTKRDRAAYNGGLFWFTDHYLSAETCTHRTYSRGNRKSSPGGYGGGPGSNHLFSRGLTLASYVTGNPLFRDAVLELADWVICMDDGRRTVFGVFDDGPTGLASATGSLEYHGPGRGAGNSVTALLDAWELSGRREYLEHAERIIQRVVHPDDRIEELNLLDAEKRWSYTVFLSTLADYLRRKSAAGQLDAMYAHAQASLRSYARWMLAHERPYFDRIEQLEYPTEAWPGQELRKANVLRMASAHEDEPLRSRMLRRGDELADRAWSDLVSFDRRASARGVALALVEGAIDGFFRRACEAPAAVARVPYPALPPERFVPQRVRVLRRLKNPMCWPGLLCSMLDARRWGRLLDARRDARRTRGADD
jgi:hypothetical protein